jgi:hypothetical protein
MNRNRLVALLWFVAVLALLLASCSGGARPKLMYFRSGT